MGSRIAVMKDGHLQQVGTPIEVYDRPLNLFVAQFIGTPPMNFLKGTLAQGGKQVSGPGFNLPVPQALQSATAPRDGQAVVVGVRPEHLSEEGTGGDLAPTIELVEPLGDHLVVHARLQEASLVFKLEPHRDVKLGQTLTVHVAPQHLHLFDAKTEQRIVSLEKETA